MNNRMNYQQNLNRAAKARLEGQGEIYQRLRNLPLEEMAKVSPSDFACLSESQLHSLLGVRHPADNGSTAGGIRKPVKSSPWLWHVKWLTLRFPPTVVASAFASAVLVFGVCSSLLMEAVKPTFQDAPRRSSDFSNWPVCPRLSPETNGCIYEVQRSLAWDDAAYFLKMPVAALRARNGHLSDFPDSLPSGSQIIVWRGRNPS